MRAELPMVRVTWHDSILRTEWNTDDELAEWIGRSGRPVISVGLLYEETPEHIVLASSYCEPTEQWANLILIPRRNIASFAYLTPGTAVKEKAGPSPSVDAELCGETYTPNGHHIRRCALPKGHGTIHDDKLTDFQWVGEEIKQRPTQWNNSIEPTIITTGASPGKV